MARNHVLLIFLVASAGHLLQAAAGISLDHIVGGSSGWRLPPTPPSTVNGPAIRPSSSAISWVLFMYTSGLQNVLEVSEKDFEECTQEEVVDMYYAGPTVLEITKPGPHYYYSGIGTHCEDGQKLSINVSATAVPDPARDGLPLPASNASAPPQAAGGAGGRAGQRRVTPRRHSRRGLDTSVDGAACLRGRWTRCSGNGDCSRLDNPCISLPCGEQQARGERNSGRQVT
ncbi:unnamed protein product [Spirodela intermedia]|uniref:Phytocyanin domain-containing protein n=1 Tax=Spirodela intermedia TaxID=51605 RepID=A0A7I8J763_SPIIN|nr:unnamed protein product [Spirodela intermedia]CAA6665899.1 unnamed protein product [Spirodela intermedia]